MGTKLLKRIIADGEDERTYLFEFEETSKRGIFIPDCLDNKLGEKVVVLISSEEIGLPIEFAGEIDWINDDEEQGSGIIFDNVTKEKFKKAIKFIRNVAYF